MGVKIYGVMRSRATRPIWAAKELGTAYEQMDKSLADGQKANADALRDCLRQEREAMGRQRREFMNEMKALYERNGLAAPQWKQRPGRMGKPPAGPGAEI